MARGKFKAKILKPTKEKPIPSHVPMASESNARKFIEDRSKNIKNSHAFSPKDKADRDYLMGAYLMLKQSLEPHISPDPIPHITNCFKYTPKQIFDGIMMFLEYTIQAGQPITLSGTMGFVGLDNNDLNNIITGKRDSYTKEAYKELMFLKNIHKFIEFYNEYSAHKKQNPAGPIFILKNFGWKDKFEIEATATQGALTPEEREVAQRRIQSFSEK